VFNPRFFVAIAIVSGAALAACGGSFGSGATPPGGLLPSGPLSGVTATASPTPSYASDIVTYGDSSQFQPLPSAAGFGGAIAFEVPSPRPSGFEAVPVGATLTLAEPTDAPDLNLATPGKKGTKRARAARPLAFISLLATRDISLSTFPRFAIDVPRDVVTTYRVEEINLGLYNSGQNDKTFRLAVVDHDLGSPPPQPSPGLTAPPPPTAIPLSLASAASPPPGFPAGSLSPAPGAPTPVGSPTLPPQRILFAAAATPLKLSANKPVVFAIYAMPIATPSPSPSPAGSGSPAASPAASAHPSSSAAPSSSAPPSAGPPSAAPSPSPTPVPTPTSG
jgi:hypothetical protein